MTTESTGKGGRRPVYIGKYEIVRHIASGGMGAVYKALDVEANREVALKVLAPEMAANPRMNERFRREANAVAKLRHENIVSLYDFGEVNGTCFLALEFIDGVDLYDHLQRHGPLKADLARELLKQAAKALAHAHSMNLVHRDIKPSNFLLTQKDGKPLLKLTDLGLARDGREEESRLTRDGTTIGTVDYMSPEQAHDSGKADIRSDIYSLGCTFYHLLAGHAPFPEGSLIEKLTKHVNLEAPDIRKLNTEVPDDLYWILERCLRKKPDDRYQTPLEVLRDLLNPQQIVPPAPRLAPLDRAAITNRKRHAADGVGLEGDKKKTGSGEKSKPARMPSKQEVADADDEARVDKARPNRREASDAGRSSRRSRKSSNPYMGWIALGGALVVILVAAMILDTLLRGQKTPPEDTGPIADNPETEKPIRKPAVIPPAPKETVKTPSALPRLFPNDVHFDLAKLQKDFEGPLAGPAATEPADAVLTVSRLGGGQAGTFATLAEALAAAPEGKRTFIVVADNGPLFVSGLPPVANRDLVLIAGKGLRPLVVWESAVGKANAFLKVTKGNVVLDGLDLVVKWTDQAGGGPASFVHVINGNFTAANCTFSATGKSAAGFTAVRLDAADLPGNCRLTGCYVRGPELTGLILGGAGWDVQIDNCLLVSGAPALVEVSCSDKSPVTLRILRSTLAAGKNCVVLQRPAGKEVTTLLQLLLLDSVFTHSDAANEGNLVMATGPVDSLALAGRVVNCLYAGWNKLLAAKNKSIRGTDLDGWRGLWGHDVGDLALADAWPAGAPTDPDEAPAAAYSTKGGPAFFGAVSSSGVLGSPLDYRERPTWLGLTFDRFVYPALALPTGTAPAEATVMNVALTKNVDLAQVLASAQPGQRLVVRVTGSGEVETRPIVLKGVDLTLYFETNRDAKAAPLVLVPDRSTNVEQEAMFDVEGGSLELINVRAVFENRNAIMPRRMLRLKGAGLQLFGCWLQGPLDKGPATFRSLIEFAGTGQEQPEAVQHLAVLRSVLMAGPKVVELQGTGARVRMQQSLVLAARDAFDCRLGTTLPARLNVQWLLEHNTFAVRRNLFALDSAAGVKQVLEPMVVQAEANVFADPFVETPRTSCLLSLPSAALHRGLVLWQGTGNAYDDKRWQTFVNLGDNSPRTTHAAWRELWGKAGEQGAVMVSWPAVPPSTFAIGAAQLDRLRVPASLGNAFGADLTKLGIGPKKK